MPWEGLDPLLLRGKSHLTGDGIASRNTGPERIVLFERRSIKSHLRDQLAEHITNKKGLLSDLDKSPSRKRLLDKPTKRSTYGRANGRPEEKCPSFAGTLFLLDAAGEFDLCLGEQAGLGEAAPA